MRFTFATSTSAISPKRAGHAVCVLVDHGDTLDTMYLADSFRKAGDQMPENGADRAHRCEFDNERTLGHTIRTGPSR